MSRFRQLCVVYIYTTHAYSILQISNNSRMCFVKLLLTAFMSFAPRVFDRTQICHATVKMSRFEMRGFKDGSEKALLHK